MHHQSTLILSALAPASVSKDAQGAQVMSVPTKSAISAPPPPGAQRNNPGALRAVLLAGDGLAVVAVPNVPIPVVPVPVPVVLEGVRAEGCRLERLTLGGVASSMMLVVGLDGEKAGAGATLAAAPALVAATAALVAVVVVLVPVEPVVVPGKGIAPEIDCGAVPGGGAGGLTVVDVEGNADCASAGPAAPSSSDAASAILPSLTAISVRRRAGARASDRGCRGRGPPRRARSSRR